MRTLKQKLTSISPLSVGLVALFAVVMTTLLMRSFAAVGPATLYTSPGGSQSVTTGGTFAVDVRISSAANVPVTGASVAMTYPSSRVEVQSISYGGSPYGLQVAESNGGGVLQMDRIANPMISGGDKLFAKITFKALSAGSAVIGFGTGSVVTSGDDDSNILNNRNGVTYTISDPVAPPPPTGGSAPSSSSGTSSTTPKTTTLAPQQSRNPASTTQNPTNNNPATPQPTETQQDLNSNEQAPIVGMTNEENNTPSNQPTTTASVASSKKAINPLVIIGGAILAGIAGSTLLYMYVIRPRITGNGIGSIFGHSASDTVSPAAKSANSLSQNTNTPGSTFTPQDQSTPPSSPTLDGQEKR